MKILLVEDEAKLAAHVGLALERQGHEVRIINDGVEAIDAALKTPFQLIVLDVNLPGADGLEVLRRVRQASLPVRVLMLTARSEIGDRVAGLKAGADDYLSKPFALEELLARVEVLGRRAAGVEPSDVLTAQDVRMDVRQRRLWRGGEEVAGRQWRGGSGWEAEAGRQWRGGADSAREERGRRRKRGVVVVAACVAVAFGSGGEARTSPLRTMEAMTATKARPFV